MCFVVKFSKYISVPILTEWLNRVDVLLFDASLVNRVDHEWLLSLMTEFSSLVQYRLLLISMSSNEASLLLLCGWYRRFGLPDEVLCRVRISMFDLTLLSKYSLMSSCTEVFKRITNVDIEFGMYDLSVPGDLLSTITTLRCLIVFSFVDTLKYFEQSSCLTSLIVRSTLRREDKISLVSMCRLCPLLETIEVNDDLDSLSPLCHAITVHCKQLKKLKCFAGNKYTSRNAFIFAFHSVSNSLTDIDWDVFSDKDSLVWRTRLWFKGAKLTNLNLDYSPVTTQECMKSILNCSCLRAVTLRRVDQTRLEKVVDELSFCLTNLSFNDSSSVQIATACIKCPLNTLRLDSKIALYDDDLLTIVQSCPYLSCLELECMGLNEGFLTLIAPYIRNITALTLPRAEYVNITSEDCIVLQGLKALQSLDAKFCAIEPSMFCTVLMIPSLTNLKFGTFLTVCVM